MKPLIGDSLEPCVLVIFGATGDLTHRKLYPAIYNLYRDQLLPDTFTVVSIGRRDKSTESVRQDVADSIAKVLPREVLCCR